ncbi:MAG: SAM-dependent methyltransferase [Elusimicrobia bacterium]|nr:SAM-dependent methyltransferase [Elusimicrobiota bacterium]
MSKPQRRPEKSDRDVLDNLGDLIGGQIKKGMSKLEEMMAESKKEGREAESEDDGRFLDYVKVFLDDKNIGSVTPSSKYLVERLVKSADLSDAKVVVEYGPARGVVTRHILKKMRPDAKLVAVEFNEKFYADLTKIVKDPRLIPVRGDVREIDKILAGLGIGHADCVVSGVPFSLFTGRDRHVILTKTSDLLKAGGRFVAFGYTTHLIPMLKDYFSDVDIQFEVRNIPPSFIFTALK